MARLDESEVTQCIGELESADVMGNEFVLGVLWSDLLMVAETREGRKHALRDRLPG
jgi:hypothetical protein